MLLASLTIMFTQETLQRRWNCYHNEVISRSCISKTQLATGKLKIQYVGVLLLMHIYMPPRGELYVHACIYICLPWWAIRARVHIYMPPALRELRFCFIVIEWFALPLPRWPICSQQMSLHLDNGYMYNFWHRNYTVNKLSYWTGL